MRRKHKQLGKTIATVLVTVLVIVVLAAVLVKIGRMQNIPSFGDANVNKPQTIAPEDKANLFDPDAVTPNKEVTQNGTIVDSSQMISKTYHVPQGKTAITCSYINPNGFHESEKFFVAFFDIAMNMLQFQNDSTHTIPTGAAYFIVTIPEDYSATLDRIMIQYGQKVTTFQAYIDANRNRYNYLTRTDGLSLNTDGTTMPNSARSVSDYIPCHGQKVFSAGKGAEGVYCFYDQNKNMISTYRVYSSTGASNLEIPSGAFYLRTSLSVTHNKMFTVAFSETPIRYVKYGISVSDNNTEIVSCKSVLAEILTNGGRIKFLGDSITQGVGGSGFAQNGETIAGDWKVNTSGYCSSNLFKQYIESNYSNRVLNYGTRGVRSFDITKWLDENDGYVTKEDKLLIVMIGTNNKWATTNDTLEDLADDIQWIIDWCAINGKKLILVSAPISTPLWDTQYSDGSPVKFHNEDIDRIYTEVCARNNIEYISMYQKMSEYVNSEGIDILSIFSDGLHPNDAGYEIMYNILMDELF